MFGGKKITFDAKTRKEILDMVKGQQEENQKIMLAAVDRFEKSIKDYVAEEVTRQIENERRKNDTT